MSQRDIASFHPVVTQAADLAARSVKRGMSRRDLRELYETCVRELTNCPRNLTAGRQIKNGRPRWRGGQRLAYIW